MSEVIMKRVWSFLGAVALVYSVVILTGCEDEATPLQGCSSLICELRSAPDTLSVSGHRYALWTYLWRDFQPISPPDGKPLIALVRLIEVDSLPIPAEVDLDTIWVINDPDIWGSELQDEPSPPRPNYELERIARNGPKWGPGIAVDVVVGVTFGAGVRHRVQARAQMINRTD
jgi:hypothetical protein